MNRLISGRLCMLLACRVHSMLQWDRRSAIFNQSRSPSKTSLGLSVYLDFLTFSNRNRMMNKRCNKKYPNCKNRGRLLNQHEPQRAANRFNQRMSKITQAEQMIEEVLPLNYIISLIVLEK